MNKSILYLFTAIIPLSAGDAAKMTNQGCLSRYKIVLN